MVEALERGWVALSRAGGGRERALARPAILEPDLGRGRERVERLARRDTHLGPPQVPDELEYPLIHLSRTHRVKWTQEDLKTSSPRSRLMGCRRPSSRRIRPWNEPWEIRSVIVSFHPSEPAGASSSRSTARATSATSPTR